MLSQDATLVRFPMSSSDFEWCIRTFQEGTRTIRFQRTTLSINLVNKLTVKKHYHLRVKGIITFRQLFLEELIYSVFTQQSKNVFL